MSVFWVPHIKNVRHHHIDTACSVELLCQEQEEQRAKLMEDVVACNKMIRELECDLLSRLSSTYRCIIDDADFICDLAETKVTNVLA